MAEKKLQQLFKERASLLGRLVSIKNYLIGVKDIFKCNLNLNNAELETLKQRVTRMDGMLHEFDNVQKQIETFVNSDDLQEQINEREDFENEYMSLYGCAKGILLDHVADQQDKAVVSNDENKIQNSFKMPAIKAPEFDGRTEFWLEFKSTFESLIHLNEQIDNIHKFHYLKQALKGEAAQVIKFIEFTAQGYEIAYKTLCERYDNKRLLVHNHVHALFNIESVVKESSKSLRKLIDEVSKHLRSLEILNEPTQYWDTLILYVLSQKLDSNSFRAWEEHKINCTKPSLEVFYAFAKARADLLETVDANRGKWHVKSTIRSFVAETKECMCGAQHEIASCKEFEKLSLADRFNKVRELRLCWKCLKSGHISRKCRVSCTVCKGWHNYLLHDYDRGKNKVSNAQGEIGSAAISNEAATVTSLTASNLLCNEVVLSTARVLVLDKSGRIHKTRAILDSGSQACFLTEDLAKRLQLDLKRVDTAIAGVNDSMSRTKYECEVNIRSNVSNYEINIRCLVVKNITGKLPRAILPRSQFKIDTDVQLADPNFHIPDKIEILLGANLFYSLLIDGRRDIGIGTIILQNTHLGYIVAGSVEVESSSKNEIICNMALNTDIQDQLAAFWEIENIPTNNILSPEEAACEKHFDENTNRDVSGRFVVKIPFKDSLDKLGESREQAVRRFFALERKLQLNNKLKEQYRDFMREYEQLNHMKEVKGYVKERGLITYYLPHHCVIRDDQITTKLRVVFDASAKTTSGYSLNDLQMCGPVIQDSLFSIVLRFRLFAYVITADVQKMYRQVEIDKSQRSLQRIVWRESPSDALKTFELSRVTYGTVSGSYLAIRCMQQLGREIEVIEPDIANAIAHGFYVDDFLYGSDSVKGAIHICKRVSSILASGCFQLRKWRSNNLSIFKGLGLEETSGNVFLCGQNELTKTLGLVWVSGTDNLMYNVQVNNDLNKPITKRIILSRISQIYDPLGLISPTIVVAKTLLQQLWLLKTNWDEPLPDEVSNIWRHFETEIGEINNLRIPRYATIQDKCKVELHGFSDASEKCYGGCVYPRTIGKDGTIKVNILCSKAKVAPLKSLTIPKLELCGALVLIRLIISVINASSILDFERCILWTDSTIVLGWLRTMPHLLKPFVSNRVAEIQNFNLKHEWRHISSKENPADLLSRGISPALISNAELWWKGPHWLDNEQYWPTNVIREVKLPEIKLIKTCMLNVSELKVIQIERFSSIYTLKLRVAYCLRFAKNCRVDVKDRKNGAISLYEWRDALIVLVKMVQRECFADELMLLNKGKLISKGSKLASLAPFFDNSGVLRVGRRLRLSKYSYNKKHPMLLPASHHLTELIFSDEHEALLHAGPQHLLASVRKSFWPLKGRNLARKITRQCVKCFRAKPHSINPIMGELPSQRCDEGFPFINTGVDYGGPILIKNKMGRGAKLSKCYICLFVCFSTKAVHLEAATDLTTDCFIAVLRRFVARRGKPNSIFSDNGTNFIGANNELRELGHFMKQNSNVLENKLAKENINWKFIPSCSPFMGGLWESGIKSAKFHLKRVTVNALLTFEQFYTLLVQIESVLNLRPLYPSSCDPNDYTPVSPAHLLIGRSLMDVVDPDVVHIPEHRASIYQRIQQIKRYFWNRWAKEYVSELQQRSKWKVNERNMAIDTMAELLNYTLASMELYEWFL